MALAGATPQTARETSPLDDDDIAEIAAEEIPGFFTEGDKGGKYRSHLLIDYMEAEGFPPRTRRSVEESRLDRAWRKTEERMDTNYIRETVFNVYDGPGEFDNRPERLRHDFDTILSRAGRE